MLSRPGQSIAWLHTQHDILHLVFLSALLIVLFWYLSRGPPRATTYLIGKTLLILHVVTAWSIMVLSHTCHDILDLEFLLVVSFWYFLLVVPSCWFVQKEKNLFTLFESVSFRWSPACHDKLDWKNAFDSSCGHGLVNHGVAPHMPRHT